MIIVIENLYLKTHDIGGGTQVWTPYHGVQFKNFYVFTNWVKIVVITNIHIIIYIYIYIYI